MQLFEQYRPSTWSDVKGQDKTVSRIQALVAGKRASGKAYWISGKSGTGKSTISKLLALEVADDWCIEELDAGSLTVAALREIEQSWCLAGMGEKGGRAYIVNESHGLRKDSIRQLLVMLERIPRHVVVIFTTTIDGEENLFEENLDSGPLLSRCLCFSLSQRDLAKPFAERALEIAQREKLNGNATLADMIKLCQTHRNNFRAVLSDVESGVFL